MGRKVIRKNKELAELLAKAANKGDKEAQFEAMDTLADAVAYDFNVRKGYIAENEVEAKTVTPQNQIIQQGIMDGDNYSDIFETTMLGWDESPSYPVDAIEPGTEGDYIAYSMPNTGYIPHRHVEMDEVTLNTYRIANSIDWDIKYARTNNAMVIGRYLDIFRAGFTKKQNDDAWHTILAAGLDRGLMVYDSSASAGQLTKKLISLMKIAMQRNGGGNSTSMGKFNLTDLYVSPEAMEDIRSWGTSIISDINRAEVERDPAGAVAEMFGINIHQLNELGENQEYNNYYTETLSGSLQASDVELVVGLDLSKRGVFLNPVRGNGLEVYSDDSLMRSGQLGVYGSLEQTFSILDQRSVLLGSI